MQNYRQGANVFIQEIIFWCN